MLVEIEHKIQYRYAAPVFLESNEIRIFPRNDLTQKLLDYNLSITPAPSSQTFFIDRENNTGLKTWFNCLTQSFELDFRCRVETLRTNPYDYIVDFDKTMLPGADEELLGFLSGLCEQIRSEYKYEIRENGLPKTPEQTRRDKCGACRDFAVLFAEECRSRGLEARFVSGYLLDDDVKEDAHLHAWAEVYIPGGGWRGYDPVNGIATADRHIAVAASADPSQVLPVIGTYRSNVGESEMKYSLNVTKFSNC